MSRRRLPTTASHFLVSATLAALASTGLAAAPAAASDPEPCGLITEHEMAQAFGLTDAVPHHAVLREPGNPAGVIHIRCRVFAWSGPKPTNVARRRAGTLAGTVASFRVETWVTDPGPFAETWLASFPTKLEGLLDRAKAQFTERDLQGHAFTPPSVGAEAALGYQAVTGGVRKLRAFWWNRASGTLISFNALGAKDKPLAFSVGQLAATIVPGVG